MTLAPKAHINSYYHKLRDDGLHAVRKSSCHPKPQSFLAPVQPFMGTSQESRSSDWYGRDCLDRGNQSVRARFTIGLFDGPYTRNVLGPSVCLWLGNSLRGRNPQADCEDLSEGKCQSLLVF